MVGTIIPILLIGKRELRVVNEWLIGLTAALPLIAGKRKSQDSAQLCVN